MKIILLFYLFSFIYSSHLDKHYSTLDISSQTSTKTNDKTLNLDKGFGILKTFESTYAINTHTSWSKELYPNPWSDPGACMIEEPGFLCDPDEVLSAEYREIINAKLLDIQETILMYCDGTYEGYQVAVAVVQGIDDVGIGENEAAAIEFAEYLMDAWGIGAAACNNGVILFLTIDQGIIYIYAGAGVTELLTPSLCEEIAMSMCPDLGAGNYDEAMYYGVCEVAIVLDNDEFNFSEDDDVSTTAIVFLVLAILCCFSGVAYYVKTQQKMQRQYDQYGNATQNQQQQRGSHENSQYPPNSQQQPQQNYQNYGNNAQYPQYPQQQNKEEPNYEYPTISNVNNK